MDSDARFYLAGVRDSAVERDSKLVVLRQSWDQAFSRQSVADSDWILGLSDHLNHMAESRISHVRDWISANLSRFQTSHASVEELRRALESAAVDLKASVQLCRMQCGSCHLLCVHGRLHEGPHSCQTNHECAHNCDYCQVDSGIGKSCGML